VIACAWSAKSARDRFSMSRGCVAPAMEQILAVLEPAGRTLQWRASDVEANGDGAEALHAASDDGRSISFDELRQVAGSVFQLIEGEFEGHDAMGQVRIRVRAVDSSCFDVESDESVVSAVEARFSNTRRYEL
jgi:hypothetical protein